MRGDTVAARAPGLGRIAGEELGLALLGDDVEPVDRAVRRPEADAPGVPAAALRAEQDEIVETERSFGLAERALGGLHRERVCASPSVALEVDASCRESIEQARDVARLDPAVVRAVRERDDVAREAVTADVGRLPDLGGTSCIAESLV